jgi:hypothetical protein
MSDPSRQDIRTQLRHAARQINRVAKQLTGWYIRESCPRIWTI